MRRQGDEGSAGVVLLRRTSTTISGVYNMNMNNDSDSDSVISIALVELVG